MLRVRPPMLQFLLQGTRDSPTYEPAPELAFRRASLVRPACASLFSWISRFYSFRRGMPFKTDSVNQGRWESKETIYWNLPAPIRCQGVPSMDSWYHIVKLPL